MKRAERAAIIHTVTIPPSPDHGYQSVGPRSRRCPPHSERHLAAQPTAYALFLSPIIIHLFNLEVGASPAFPVPRTPHGTRGPPVGDLASESEG